MNDVGSLTYEELLSELHALIGQDVQVTVHGWNARRDERRLVAILGGRLAAGYAADFSAIRGGASARRVGPFRSQA